MTKRKFIMVIALIIQMILFVKFKLDIKKLEIHDLYVNLVMPLLSIILIISSLDEGDEGNGGNDNGNRTISDVNDVDDPNEPGSDNAVIDNEINYEINNGGQINDVNEIIDENKNDGQPDEQRDLDKDKMNEMEGEYLYNN